MTVYQNISQYFIRAKSRIIWGLVHFQLRICSKKKQTKSDGTEPNMGWSWLERWMATRHVEVSPVEDRASKQLISNEAASTAKIRPFSKKKFLDLSFEEKESCGSNEVPVQVDSSATPERDDKDGCDSPRNRLKAPRSISRRKTVPTYYCQKEHFKVLLLLNDFDISNPDSLRAQ